MIGNLANSIVYSTKNNLKINILENLRYELIKPPAKNEVVIFRFYYKIIVRLITDRHNSDLICSRCNVFNLEVYKLQCWQEV